MHHRGRHAVFSLNKSEVLSDYYSAMKNQAKSNTLSRWFNVVSTRVTRLTGKPVTSIIAFLLVIVWALTGPLFDYSDTWQLVINTSTTIITFLMVFIIQQSQNKDTMAIQLKLNELIACNEKASNRLIEIEDLTEEELEVLKKFYVKLSGLAKNDKDLFSSHSIDEVQELHRQKSKARGSSKQKG
jgi:low affinity Fe/Cu permease